MDILLSPHCLVHEESQVRCPWVDGVGGGEGKIEIVIKEQVLSFLRGDFNINCSEEGSSVC